MVDAEMQNALPAADSSAIPSAELGDGSGAPQTQAASEPGKTANGSVDDSKLQKRSMMPPPKRMPPPIPKFNEPSPPAPKPSAHDVQATGACCRVQFMAMLAARSRLSKLMMLPSLAVFAARAKARTTAVAAAAAAAAAAAKSSLPAQRERAVAEAAARVI